MCSGFKRTASRQFHLLDFIIDPSPLSEPAAPSVPNPAFRDLCQFFESADCRDEFEAIPGLLSELVSFLQKNPTLRSLSAELRQIQFIKRLIRFIDISDQAEADESDQSIVELAMEAIDQSILHSPLLAKEVCEFRLPDYIDRCFQLYNDDIQFTVLDVFAHLFDLRYAVGQVEFIRPAILLAVSEMGAGGLRTSRGCRLAANLARLQRLAVDDSEDSVIRLSLLTAFLAVSQTAAADALRGIYCLCHLHPDLLISNRAIFAAAKSAIQSGSDSKAIFYAIYIIKLYYAQPDDDVFAEVHWEMSEMYLTLWNIVRNAEISQATKILTIEFVTEMSQCDPESLEVLCRTNIFNLVEEVFETETVMVKVAACVMVSVGIADGNHDVKMHLARPSFVQESVDLLDQITNHVLVELILQGILAAIENVEECANALMESNGADGIRQLDGLNEQENALIEQILARLSERFES